MLRKPNTSHRVTLVNAHLHMHMPACVDAYVSLLTIPPSLTRISAAYSSSAYLKAPPLYCSLSANPPTAVEPCARAHSVRRTRQGRSLERKVTV